MAWHFQSVARSGQYVLLEAESGFSLDLVSTVELQAELHRRAIHWEPLSVSWIRGIFGYGETLRILGRVTTDVDTVTIAQNAAQAVNSFWTIAGARFRILVSDNPYDPIPTGQKDYSDTVKWALIAATLIVGVILIVQIRKGLE